MSDVKIPNINNTNLNRINPLLLPLPWLVVALLVIVFLAMRYSNISGVEQKPEEIVKIFPQTYITGVALRQFDKDGNLQTEMTTPLIRQFQVEKQASAQDYSLFTEPAFQLINDPEKPAWFISAKEGRLDSNNVWFTLTGDVLAKQNSLKQGETTITTDNLRLNTQEQFAETSKAVTMRAAKSQTTAVGLHADIKREHIKLLSNVKGRYEP